MCFLPYSTLFTSANPLNSLLNSLIVEVDKQGHRENLEASGNSVSPSHCRLASQDKQWQKFGHSRLLVRQLVFFSRIAEHARGRGEFGGFRRAPYAARVQIEPGDGIAEEGKGKQKEKERIRSVCEVVREHINFSSSLHEEELCASRESV